jgi:hypothetical protein
LQIWSICRMFLRFKRQDWAMTCLLHITMFNDFYNMGHLGMAILVQDMLELDISQWDNDGMQLLKSNLSTHLCWLMFMHAM